MKDLDRRLVIWNSMTPEQRDYDRVVARQIPFGATMTPETDAGWRALDERYDLDDAGCRCHINPPCSYCTSTPEEEADMSSKALGLYAKYNVERVDGKPVDDCFVMELRDANARAALRTYIDAVKKNGYEMLAVDIEKKLSTWADPIAQKKPPEKRTRIYLSGKMTGLPDDGKPAFYIESERLRGLGFEVFNPAELPKQESYQDYMRLDIAGLTNCDWIVYEGEAQSGLGEEEAASAATT